MATSGSREKKGGNTRLPSSKTWCFTWNNYFNELKNKDGLDGFASFIGGLGVYVFQEEKGDSGTEHLQGCIKFHDKCRPMEKIKYKSIHWEKCINWESSKKYCSKEDTRNGDIYTNIDKTTKPNIRVHEPYGWQLDVLDIVTQVPDERSIHWFWSEKGGIGKTTLCKYLAVKHDALIIDGTASDMKYIVACCKEYPKLCILNIPRQKSALSYAGLEAVKDGCFASTKYEGKMVLGDCPHVIVFANWEPDTDTDNLSSDRWIITEIKL